MGCVEEKVKAGGSGFMGGSGAHTTCLLEEMKLLKEMQDQSGLFISIKKKKKIHLLSLVFFLQVLVTWSKFNTLH